MADGLTLVVVGRHQRRCVMKGVGLEDNREFDRDESGAKQSHVIAFRKQTVLRRGRVEDEYVIHMPLEVELLARRSTRRIWIASTQITHLFIKYIKLKIIIAQSRIRKIVQYVYNICSPNTRLIQFRLQNTICLQELCMNTVIEQLLLINSIQGQDFCTKYNMPTGIVTEYISLTFRYIFVHEFFVYVMYIQLLSSSCIGNKFPVFYTTFQNHNCAIDNTLYFDRSFCHFL
jgi:hypothetical protein